MTTANLPIPPSSPAPVQPYVDRKRFAWVLSLLVPLSIATGPLLWFWYPHTLMLWLPVFFVYGVAPALDWMLGTDTSNPPESAVPGLEADPYYRRVTFALVPLLWAAFIGAAWFSQEAGIAWLGLLGLIISTGGVGGFCINLGHEIGHKRGPLERWLAKLILAPTFYGHFTIEHNRGHHRDVATPQDPASSRMGESIWRFVWREMPGAWRRAWALERERTRLDGQAFWSWHNEILQAAAITVALWAGLSLWPTNTRTKRIAVSMAVRLLAPFVMYPAEPAGYSGNCRINYLQSARESQSLSRFSQCSSVFYRSNNSYKTRSL